MRILPAILTILAALLLFPALLPAQELRSWHGGPDWHRPKSEWEGYWKNATVGDYVHYIKQGEWDLFLRLEVVELEGRKVTIEITYNEEGQEKKEQQVLIFDGPEPKVARYEGAKRSRETILAVDDTLKLDCERIEWPAMAVPRHILHKSPLVPLEGIVREYTGWSWHLDKFQYAKTPK